MYFCAIPEVWKITLSSSCLLFAVFRNRTVTRNILSFLDCRSSNRRLASLPYVIRSDGMISMSYPDRTAFFCSSIFIRLISVTLLFTSLIAFIWSMDWTCRLTTRFLSMSRNSASILSVSSGARICR